MVNDASLHTPLFPGGSQVESGALPWRLVTTVVCLVVVAASAISAVQDGAPWLSSLLLTLLCVSLIMNIWLPANAWGRKRLERPERAGLVSGDARARIELHALSGPLICCTSANASRVA